MVNTVYNYMINALPALYNIQTLDIYIYYDQPVLFSGQDPFGQKYLVVLAEETQDGEIWLCAEISDDTLENINSKKLDFHDVFVNEDSVKYSMFLEFNTANYKIEKLTNLKPEWIPDCGINI